MAAIQPLIDSSILQAEDLSSYRLIMPSVSAGNVGQLAADLLIYRLGAKYLGSPDLSDLLAPVIGICPFSDERRMFSAFEIYSVPGIRLLIIQQRSDVLRHKKKEFLDRLVVWLQTSKFKFVLLLSGCLAVARWDSELARNTVIHYLPSKIADELNLNGLDRIEKKVDPVFEDQLNYILPGGGITKALYARCETLGIPLLPLVRYCMEGDNTEDGRLLASASISALSIDVPVRMINSQPNYWKFLFGADTH